jgi:hypothetical protein
MSSPPGFKETAGEILSPLHILRQLFVLHGQHLLSLWKKAAVPPMLLPSFLTSCCELLLFSFSLKGSENKKVKKF